MKRDTDRALGETSNSVENVLWSVMTFVITIKRSHGIFIICITHSVIHKTMYRQQNSVKSSNINY